MLNKSLISSFAFKRKISTCLFTIKSTYSTNTNSHLLQNKFNNYSVSDVSIPVPGGQLAGKLWEPNPSVSRRDLKIPPIICLHGWLDNCGTFDTLLPLLMRETTTFLALDLPGHGYTTYCSQWFFDGFLDGIISVQRTIRHFGWEKVSLFGHSFGSVVGFLFNGLYPELVEKYIAMEIMRPVPRSCSDTLRAAVNLVFEVEERNKIPRKAYPYDQMIQRFYEGRQETISMEGCKILLKRGAVPVDENLYQYSYNFRTLIPGQEGRITAEQSEEFAQKIISHVCYIKADPGNRYEPDEEYETFFKIFEKNLSNNFETHCVPGTHHFHLNNPELVAPIISRFLRL